VIRTRRPRNDESVMALPGAQAANGETAARLHRSSHEREFMPRKLKVFRMPIGFEDAYVAAPSRKAALAAWGAEHDQFARGVAEEVTDPKLAKEPLAHPGEVIRTSRGDLASQLKALPKHPRKQAAKVAARAPAKKRPKPKPPPKRDRLDAAEAALNAARERHRAEIEKLERQLEVLRAKQERELASLSRKRDAAREAYSTALEAWSEG
jgi:hypothetical protein